MNRMLWFGASIVALAGSPLAAQQIPDRADTVDETAGTIIVTGQKTERTLLDTQASVAVVTGEEIIEKDLTSFREAFRTMANVIDADFVDAGFVIRGVNSEGLTPGGAPLGGGSISTARSRPARLPGEALAACGMSNRSRYIADRNRHFRAAQLWLARFTSTLAIHVTTTMLRRRLSYGELDSFDAAIAGGGAIIDDVLAFRVAAEYQRRDSEIDYPTYAEFANYDRLIEDEYYQIRGKLRADPAPGLRVRSDLCLQL